MTNKIYRVEYIDFLKGLLLTFICFSHFGYLPYFLNLLIILTGSIYVPVFFLISGLLFNASISFIPFLQKRIKSLLVPYLFFFLLFIVLDWNSYVKPFDTFRSVFNLLIRASGPPKASPIWFIIRLFEVNLVYYCINYYLPKSYLKFILVIICSLLGYVFYINYIKLPFAFDVILSSISFFGVGHLGREYLNIFIVYLNRKSHLTNFLVFNIFLFTSLLLDFLNANSVLAQNRIGNYFLFYAAAIFGGISLVILSNFLIERFSAERLFKQIFTFFQYLSKNALIILATHVFIIIIIDLVIKRIAIISPNQGFVLKLLTIFTLTYYFIVPLLYNKFYFIFGKEKPISNKLISFNVD